MGTLFKGNYHLKILRGPKPQFKSGLLWMKEEIQAEKVMTNLHI
jgi:hypothetical protein